MQHFIHTASPIALKVHRKIKRPPSTFHRRRAKCPWYHFFSFRGIPGTSLRASDNALCCNGQTRRDLAACSATLLWNHIPPVQTCLLSANKDSLSGRISEYSFLHHVSLFCFSHYMKNHFLELLRRNFRFGRMRNSRTAVMAGCCAAPMVPLS